MLHLIHSFKKEFFQKLGHIVLLFKKFQLNLLWRSILWFKMKGDGLILEIIKYLI